MSEPQPELIGNLYADTATLLRLIEDVERAVTPEEKAAAGLALDVELTLQMEASVELAYRRLRESLAKWPFPL